MTYFKDKIFHLLLFFTYKLSNEQVTPDIHIAKKKLYTIKRIKLYPLTNDEHRKQNRSLFFLCKLFSTSGQRCKETSIDAIYRNVVAEAYYFQNDK